MNKIDQILLEYEGSNSRCHNIYMSYLPGKYRLNHRGTPFIIVEGSGNGGTLSKHLLGTLVQREEGQD